MRLTITLLGFTFDVSLGREVEHLDDDEIEMSEEDCFTSSLLSVYE